MEQLLNITTVPFSMEAQVQHAKLEISVKSPAVQVERVKGTYTVDHTYPRLLVDTFDARSSMGMKTALEASRESAAKSMQDAKEGVARIAQEGNSLMRIQDGVTIHDVAVSRVMQRYKENSAFTIGAVPSVPASISWEPGMFSIDFNADQLHFNWDTQYKPEYQFTPASIHYKILQLAHCEIEFIGDPLYFPPSSAPNPDEDTPTLDITA